MRRARLGWVALSVALGACRFTRSGESNPRWDAEPLSLVDLPGEERPTAVQFLGERGFVVSYQLRDHGGARFRTLQGAPWSRPDLDLEPSGSGEGVALSPDGTVVAVAGYDQVHLVPLAGGPPRTLSMRGAAPLDYCGGPWSLVWGRPGAQGTLAVRCALGPPLTLIDVESGRLTFPSLGHDVEGARSTASDLSLSRDGDTLVVVGETTHYANDTTTHWVELRALPDGAPRRRFTLSRAFGDAALSPDSARLAVSSPYWGLQILDAASGRVLADLNDPPDRANAGSGDVVWSPDGALLYRVGQRLSISVHDGATARLRGYLPAHAADVTSGRAWGSPASLAGDNGHLALSPEGRYLAALSRADIGPGKARAVRVWRLPVRGPGPSR
jgi:WD40 repeat protein